MMIKDIENLPTYASQSAVTKWLNRVMESFDSGVIDREEMIACLYELADQQWHQYKLIPKADCMKVEQWALSVMDLSDRPDAEVLVTLASCLGFSLEIVKQLADKVIFDDLRNEFYNILRNSFEDRVDPYDSLR